VRLTNREIETVPGGKPSQRQPEKLTVAAVVSAERGDIDLDRLKDLADALSDDWEIIVVAHGLTSELTLKLIVAIKEIPDATAHFLDGPCNNDIARLAALDMAIGDRILLVDWENLDDDIFRKMLEIARQGTDVVVESGAGMKEAFAYRTARGTFLRIYNAISGLRIDRHRFANRLYSREAARYLLTRREAEMLLNTVYLADAFPGLIVQRELASVGQRTQRGTHVMRRTYRALNFARSVPLRFVIFICLLSAVLNVSYMAFAVITKLVDSNVEPGWSSLSLQISGIFLLLSIILGIIAEHLIEVDRAVNRRPNYHVLREVRSPLSNARRKRNIVEMP
jgi:polyisoprenyl-phosphate glycosyltransferase